MLNLKKTTRALGLLFVFVLVATFFVLIVEHYEPNKRNAEQEAKNDSETKATEILATERMAYYANVLAIVTGGLLVFGLAQIYYLVRADQTSEVNSKAALKSAKAAEENLTKLQRAFVAPRQIRYLSHLRNDGSVWWSFHIYWHNSGNSQARNVKSFFAKYFEKEDMPMDFAFAITGEQPETYIAPHAEISAELSVTSEELIAADAGERFLYLWGRLDYRDVFEGTPGYVTRYLVKVAGFRGDVSKPWNDKTNIVEILLPHAPRHNDAT